MIAHRRSTTATRPTISKPSFRTHPWLRETRGRITALPHKAVRAAAFVDSFATAFGMPAPERIDYYVAVSVDQALEILGVVVPERIGAA